MKQYRIYYSGSELIKARSKREALTKFVNEDFCEIEESITGLIEEDDSAPTNVPVIDTETPEDKIVNKQDKEIEELAANDPDLARALTDAQYNDEEFAKEQARLNGPF